MPDRMIREGLKTSLLIERLDDGAETFYVRLCLSADKNGIYHAEPELLRAAVYPLKTTLRTTEVRRRRDACIHAGLLRQWTASDGRPYVQVLKFGQRVPKERPKYPLPPGDPDESGQESLGLPEPPLVDWKGSKGNGGKRASAAQPPVLVETQEQTITRLRARFTHIDIDAQLQLATDNRRKAGRVLDLAWFESSWLPKCGRVYKAPTANVATPVVINPNPGSIPNVFSALANQDPLFSRHLANAD